MLFNRFTPVHANRFLMCRKPVAGKSEVAFVDSADYKLRKTDSGKKILLLN